MMRLRKAVTGMALALGMTGALATGAAPAHADSYYSWCDGVMMQIGEGSSSVMWYDHDGNWGYVDSWLPLSYYCYD